MGKEFAGLRKGIETMKRVGLGYGERIRGLWKGLKEAREKINKLSNSFSNQGLLDGLQRVYLLRNKNSD